MGWGESKVSVHHACDGRINKLARRLAEVEAERDAWEDRCCSADGTVISLGVRLAEVEQALRSDAATEAACVAYIPRWDEYSIWQREQWRARMRVALAAAVERAHQVAQARAVLDKGEPEVEQALRPKVTINIESRRDDDGGFAAGYSSGLRDGRRGR